MVQDGQSWKWVDYRRLAAGIIARRWPGSAVQRLVYCTARVAGDVEAAQRQDVYIRALRAAGAADVIEEGFFVSRVTPLPLAWQPARGADPQLVRRESWAPLPDDLPLRRSRRDAEVVVADVLKQEEKGSDVNVATWLMADVLGGVVDAAVVLTNDSDLGLPLAMMRNYVPVGLVNPRGSATAGALRGDAAAGVGGHWWGRLKADDFVGAQLPDVVTAPDGRSIHRPPGW